MSSHHFVKEDQEPALLIIDPDAIAFEKVQELLEWSPLVIVSYSSLEMVLSWEIKIDVLLASTSDPIAQLVIDQAPLHIIHSSEDNNVLESVCTFLLDRKQNNLNVIAHEAHAMIAIAKFVSERVNIVIFEGKVRWHLVENGTYSKWLPAQSNLKVFNNGKLEEIMIRQNGISKIERDSAFWVGEEF